jgi:hypothetical protein
VGVTRGSLGVPLIGVGVAFVALLLWLSPLSWRALDTVVLVLFAVGLVLSLAGYFFGADATTRRLGVVGVGANAVGLVILAVVYAGG